MEKIRNLRLKMILAALLAGALMAAIACSGGDADPTATSAPAATTVPARNDSACRNYCARCHHCAGPNGHHCHRGPSPIRAR